MAISVKAEAHVMVLHTTRKFVVLRVPANKNRSKPAKDPLYAFPLSQGHWNASFVIFMYLLPVVT